MKKAIIKNIEKARNIARMNRQQEYKNQQRMEELNVKEQKIEDFKKQNRNSHD